MDDYVLYSSITDKARESYGMEACRESYGMEAYRESYGMEVYESVLHSSILYRL